MDASYRLIWFLMLCCFSNLVFAQDYENPEGLDPQISRFQRNARSVKSTKTPKPFPGCGFRSSNSQGKSAPISNTGSRVKGTGMVVGGAFAGENAWPWMIALYKRKAGQGSEKLHCGASLISKNYILTAAHCFHAGTNTSKYFVVVGAHTRRDGILYPVKKILIHPDYKYPINYNDIALIKVVQPIKLSEKVYPVCLPTEELKNKFIKGNSKVTVTGWGSTSDGGEDSEKLQELTVSVVPFNRCKEIYGTSKSRPQGITRKQICAGIKEGGKDACQGDSGGPLVSQMKDNTYVQLGIVSTGKGCARPGFPGIYTRVSYYIKWIYDNTDLYK